MHLPTNVEIQTARTALQQLRSSLGDLEQKKRTTDTRSAIELLHKLQQDATAAVESISHVSHVSFDVRMLMHEHARVTEKVNALVAELAAFHNYPGPRRVRMTTKEKVDYIRKNGGNRFSKLPY